MDRHYRRLVIYTGKAYTETKVFACINIPLCAWRNSGFEYIWARLLVMPVTQMKITGI
jgi:hypothetical protein